MESSLQKRLIHLPACDSTNDEAKKKAFEQAPSGLIVLADKQTSGRGRRGNTWHSTPGQSLTFSYLFKPKLPTSLWPRLALLSGLALARTLEKHRLTPEIKWPNDLLLQGKKIAGILVEAQPPYLIVGIGINLKIDPIPEEIAATATSLHHHLSSPLSPLELLEQILPWLDYLLASSETDFPQHIQAVNERCAYIGQKISLIQNKQKLTATLIEIRPDGELLIQEQGQLKTILHADEIRSLE